MILFRRLCNAFKPAPTLYIEVKIGKRGKYRWYAYDKHGHLLAQAPIGGEHSFSLAMSKANKLFGDSYRFEMRQSKTKKAKKVV